jgi:hypothetical protein
MPTRRSLMRGSLSLPCGITAAVISIAACGNASPVQPARTPQPTSAATPRVAALADLFITTVPSEFMLEPDSVGDTGPSDLAKAARDDGSPNAATLLTQEGFVAGYQRLWARQPDGAYVVIFLYQFDNPTGARRYQQHGIGLLSADHSAQTTPLSVPGISGATGLTGMVQGKPVESIVFAKGNYLVQVGMRGASATPVVASQLAQDQFARLP